MPKSNKFLTVTEASKRMKISKRTVRELCKKGYLPGSKQSRSRGPWQIPNKAVENWVAEPNMPPKSWWEMKWFIGLGAIVALIAGIAGIWADSGLREAYDSYNATPLPTATNALLLYPAEGENETLIVVANFYRTEGVVDVDVKNEIRRAIENKINDLNLSNVRVIAEPTVIKSENRSQAIELGEKYNASLIIWGSDTGIRLEVNFLNLKGPTFDLNSAIISETEKTQVALPNAYSQFVINELPQELTFLAFYALGEAKARQLDFDGAVELIETAIATLPDSYNEQNQLLGLDYAYMNLGVLNLLNNKISEVLNNLDQAIKLNDKNAEAYNARGFFYTLIQLDVNRALENFNHAIEIDPGFSDALNNRGILHLSEGNYNLAIDDFNMAIQNNPQMTFAMMNRALAYELSDKFDQAVQSYDDVLEIEPENYFALVYRGSSWMELGKFEEALTDLDAAVKIEPDIADAYYNRGLLYRRRERFYLAIEDYTKAVNLEPDYIEAFNNRGAAYLYIGQYEKALIDFNQVLDIDPDHIITYANRGSAYKFLGEYEKAILDFQKYLLLDPTSPNRTEIENEIQILEAELEK